MIGPKIWVNTVGRVETLAHRSDSAGSENHGLLLSIFKVAITNDCYELLGPSPEINTKKRNKKKILITKVFDKQLSSVKKQRY